MWLVASTDGSTVPFQSSTSGAGAFSRMQWYSTFSRTTVQVGFVPARASVPAGRLGGDVLLIDEQPVRGERGPGDDHEHRDREGSRRRPGGGGRG